MLFVYLTVPDACFLSRGRNAAISVCTFGFHIFGNHRFLHSWWRHRNGKSSALLALCAGNSPVTGELHAQRTVTGSFDVSFDCVWINSWVNNREAGDLRRHRAHYGVQGEDWTSCVPPLNDKCNHSASIVPSTATWPVVWSHKGSTKVAVPVLWGINILWPEENGWHLADDIFIYILLNANYGVYFIQNVTTVCY